VLAFDQTQWRSARLRFLFPVRALSRVFRGKFLAGLAELFRNGQLLFPDWLAPLGEAAAFRLLLRRLYKHDWVVYSKPPFAGPEKLLDYLGRYTQRVAISNSRLLGMADGQVSFSYRDRGDGDRRKTATLPAADFIRRFLHHVLPKAFVRVRHYGLLANRGKSGHLQRCRQLLGAAMPTPPPKRTTAQWLLHLTGFDINVCPQCGQQLHSTIVPRPRLTVLALPARPALARAPPSA
jgi:hypothetical protein